MECRFDHGAEAPADAAATGDRPIAIAANSLFAHYARRLVAIADGRLHRHFRAKVSPEDVVQSAFKSYLRRGDDLRAFEPGHLWGLLVVITLRKCSKWSDVFRSEKRSVRRETPFQGDGNDGGLDSLIPSLEPGPAEIAVFRESLARILGRFPPRQQQMVLWRAEGWELEEIADRSQSSRRTVARVIARAKQLILAEFSDGNRN